MAEFATAEVVGLEDPSGERRIQIRHADGEQQWARMAFPYASRNAGWSVLPEIGDEVVVALLGSEPIILGSLYSPRSRPPGEVTSSNDIKLFRSRSGVEIVIDDARKSIELKTPGNARVRLSDDAKSICLSDANGNVFEMTPDGIRLHSPKRVEIACDGELSITSTSNALIASKMAMTIDALTASLTGQMDVKVHGSASASLTADGQTTVKGAMVMIN